MGSSATAIADAEEQEQYRQDINRIHSFLEGITPQEYLRLIEDLNKELDSITKHNMAMGTQGFWATLGRLKTIAKTLKG